MGALAEGEARGGGSHSERWPPAGHSCRPGPPLLRPRVTGRHSTTCTERWRPRRRFYTRCSAQRRQRTEDIPCTAISPAQGGERWARCAPAWALPDVLQRGSELPNWKELGEVMIWGRKNVCRKSAEQAEAQ